MLIGPATTGLRFRRLGQAPAGSKAKAAMGAFTSRFVPLKWTWILARIQCGTNRGEFLAHSGIPHTCIRGATFFSAQKGLKGAQDRAANSVAFLNTACSAAFAWMPRIAHPSNEVFNRATQRSGCLFFSRIFAITHS